VLGGVQGGGPHTLEQGAHLLHLAAHVDDELVAAGTQVPQPAPGLVGRLGEVAAQLRGQSGDQHRVLLVGLVEGQVFAAPGPGGQRRLHAHERHRPFRRELSEDPPPVTGRLARHRRPGEPLPGGSLTGPVQRGTQIPGAAPERATCQHPRVVITDHDHLLVVGQVDTAIAF
jgi:hypothetical protein